MKQLIVSIGIVALLWGATTQARSCREEPERCPVLRWICTEPVPLSGQNYVYHQASITSTLFTSADNLMVTEHFCSGTPRLTCREQRSQGRWYLYPKIPQGQLVNQVNGQIILVNCTEYNENVL